MKGMSLPVARYGDLVGTEVGISPWLLVDQARIDRFAEVTDDEQFIHVDPIAAAQSRFGSTIAHGFLSLSLLSAMAEASMPKVDGGEMMVNYGFNSVRFLAPVLSQKRVRGRFVLKEFKERSPGQWQTTVAATIEIEGEERPALVAEWLMLTVVAANDALTVSDNEFGFAGAGGRRPSPEQRS